MSGRFPEPGKTFEGKYRVDKLLGSGGFARVYLAEQTDLGRPVAIKVLSPKVAEAIGGETTDPKVEAVAIRFEREARVISQLRSPHTITMYDYGRTDSGLLYMVMEYVDGIELDELEVPIAPRRVVKILKQVLQSLHEAHAHDLLHRDLKPANIMLYEHLGERDQVKLLDFGIAKAVGQASQNNEKDLTAADTLIGTPRYMSPEQIRGHDIGPASDIYSLGLVIYELLVGEKAITNSDSIEILGRHLSSDTFEIPRDHAVHPDLRRLINKMVVKQPDRRYASTADVLEDLAGIEQIDGDLTLDAVPAPPPLPAPGQNSSDDGDDGAAADAGGPATGEPGTGDAGKKKTIVVGVLIGAVLASAAVGVWLLGDWGAGTGGDEAQPVVVEADEDNDSDEDEEGEEAGVDEEREQIITLIRTRPEGASVWIGDRLLGMAPVQLNSADVEFPLTVRATMGERSDEKRLEAPGSEVWLDVAERDELAEREDGAGDEPANAGRADRADEPADKPADKAPRRTRTKKPSSPKKPEPAAKAEKPDTKPPSTSKAEPSEEEEEEDVDTRKYLPLD
ncbi:MAG: protein kinase domain-containing protein [Persicimonas sp.]